MLIAVTVLLVWVLFVFSEVLCVTLIAALFLFLWSLGYANFSLWAEIVQPVFSLGVCVLDMFFFSWEHFISPLNRADSFLGT